VLIEYLGRAAVSARSLGQQKPGSKSGLPKHAGVGSATYNSGSDVDRSPQQGHKAERPKVLHCLHTITALDSTIMILGLDSCWSLMCSNCCARYAMVSMSTT